MAGGQVSAEVTFNSAELESWNLWSRCRRPWDDLGMVIRDKPEIVLSHPHPSIACRSSASQWSSLWPFRIQVALNITDPSVNPMVSAMYTLASPSLIHVCPGTHCWSFYFKYPAYAAMLG